MGLFQPIKISGPFIIGVCAVVFLRPRESGELLGTKAGQLADGVRGGAENFQTETAGTSQQVPVTQPTVTQPAVATAPLVYTCPVTVPEPLTLAKMEQYGCWPATSTPAPQPVTATILQPTATFTQADNSVSWPKMGAGIMCFTIAAVYLYRLYKTRKKQAKATTANTDPDEETVEFATAGFPTSQDDDGTWIQPEPRRNSGPVIDATCTEGEPAEAAA